MDETMDEIDDRKTGRFVLRQVISEIGLSYSPEIIEWTKESICHKFADVLTHILSDGRKYQVVFLTLGESPADPTGKTKDIAISLYADIVLLIAGDAHV